MRRILFSILGLTLLGFLAYSLYIMYSRPSGARLEGIDIVMKSTEGVEPFMDEEDVRREMLRKGLKLEGILIDSIDVGKVEQSLRQNPLFSDIEVYITPNSRRMKVEVKQQVALFLVHNNERSYYVSNERGIIPMNPNYAIYVPIVTGEVNEDVASRELFDLVSTIKADPYFANYFGQIHYTKKEGVILCPRIGNSPLILGHNSDYKGMLHKYRVFAEAVFPRTGNNAYEYIKLGYKDQVITRKRNWQAETPETMP